MSRARRGPGAWGGPSISTELAGAGQRRKTVLRALSRPLGARASATAFIAPALLVLLVMNLLPLLWSFGMSLYRFRADRPHTPPRFIGLGNYFYLLLNEDIWEHAQNTGILMASSVAVQIVVGSLLALLFYRPFPGRRLILMLVLTPMLLSTVAVGTFFNFFYDPTFGLVSAVLRPLLGRPFVPLATPTTAMISLIVADAWMWSPFVMLMLLAGLQGTPANLVEAAAIDRAGAWRRFRTVIFPSLRGVLLLAVLFRLIESFNQFDLVYTVTNGGPGTSTETLATEVYDNAFVLFETGRASALANFTTFVIIVLVQLYFQALRRSDPASVAAWEPEPERGTGARPAAVLSRGARLVVLGLVMPLAALLLVGVPYLLRHFRVYPRLLIVPPAPGTAAAVQGWPNLDTAPAGTADFARGFAPGAPTASALAVPESALVFENDGPRVWVIGSDGVPAPRPVRIGRIEGGMVEVLEGLQVGEPVVTRGALLLDRAWKGY
jgi:multiple sugar transport system permease protein